MSASPLTGLTLPAISGPPDRARHLRRSAASSDSYPVVHSEAGSARPGHDLTVTTDRSEAFRTAVGGRAADDGHPRRGAQPEHRQPVDGGGGRHRRALGGTAPKYFNMPGRGDRDKLAVAEADGDGPIQAQLAAAAQHLGLRLIGGMLPLRTEDPERVRNPCLVFGPDGRRPARHDKTHLFAYGNRRERYGEGVCCRPAASRWPSMRMAGVQGSPSAATCAYPSCSAG